MMLRYLLFVSDQFVNGRLQPYLSVGPAAFVSTLKDTDNFIPSGQLSTYTSLGVKAGAGLMFFLIKNTGVFVEYRDTQFQVKDQYYNASMVNNTTLGKTLGNATFNIQSIVAGISYRA